MTSVPCSMTTHPTSFPSGVMNDNFSSTGHNLMVLPPLYTLQSSLYAPNYAYPTNYFYTVPFWVQPITNDNHHHKDDDTVVANRLPNNMTENYQPPILKTLCSKLHQFTNPKSSKSDEFLLQDCIDGLSEYTQNFNFQFPKEQHSSRKRRRSFSGCSSDSDYTDVDSEAEDTQPLELLVLEKSFQKIKRAYENQYSKVPEKPFLPSATTEQILSQDSFTTPGTTSDLSPSYERVNQNAPIGIQIETDANGNTIYKIRGKPIKFKVVKNRPKNGLFHKTWEWHFDKLKEFMSRNGHTNVTRSVEGYEDIGTWVAEQRRKIKKGRITINQFHKLNDIGFEWDRSYYFYNTQQSKEKKPKSSSDEEVASLPSNAEEGPEASMDEPQTQTSTQVAALEPVL